jgi:dihydroorotate dehydrogenase (fumarate)
LILDGKVTADFALTSDAHTSKDVVKSMMAGAKVAMIASELLWHDSLQRVEEILRHVRARVRELEYSSIKQMQGSMSQKSVREPSAFERANYMKVLGSFRDLP